MTYGERLAVGELISLEYSLIQNPGSTAPAQPYEIEIKTDYYQVVAVQRTEGTQISSSAAA